MLQLQPTVAALSMLAPGNFPPSIPTEGHTQTGPDSSFHIPLCLVITSESEDENEDDSEVSDTDEEETKALDATLLEEDEDDDQFEDDANTTGTATPRHDDPYDIQGLGNAPVATTPTSQMDLSFLKVTYPLPSTSFCSSFLVFVVFYPLVANPQECT